MKTKTIGQILQAVYDEIIGSEKSWQQFLCTAGANIDDALVNQMLIYAFAPYTTGWLPEELWEERGCVPEGRAIVLLDDAEEFQKTMVCRTAENRLGNPNVYRQWKLNPLYAPEEADCIQKGSKTIAEAILSQCENEVTMRLETFYDDFRADTGREPAYDIQNSFVWDAMEEEKEWLAHFLVCCSHFELLQRCDINPFQVYENCLSDIAFSAHCRKEDGTLYSDAVLLLMVQIHEIVQDVAVLVEEAAKKYPDFVGYQYHYAASTTMQLAEKLSITYQKREIDSVSIPNVILPGSEDGVDGYGKQWTSTQMDYHLNHFIAWLMSDELFTHAAAYGKTVEDAKQRAVSYLIEKEGVFDADSETQRKMLNSIEMRAEEMIVDEYLN